VQAYLVEAVKQNKRNNVRHFFEEHADDLLSSPDACTWQQWLALPYMKQPWEHRTFKVQLCLKLLPVSVASYCWM
jgi:hypothetical protein